MKDMIIYEQPLNELMRVCLRLEQLFHHVSCQVTDTSSLGTRHTLTTIIHILHLLDRPDLKAKLAKELSHHIMLLNRLETAPNIDRNRLHELIQELSRLAKHFIESNGKIGQNLREIELLNSLRLHLSSPGGGCSFDIPVFHYWQQQPAETREETLKSWLKEFNDIHRAVEVILSLVREGTQIQPKHAEKGYYQEPLDPQINLRLVRVGIKTNEAAFPEISIGRHFLSVQFFIPNIHNRSIQCSTNFQFWLSHCSS